jgi:hypothetical protein
VFRPITVYLKGGTVGDSIKPARQRPRLANGGSALGQGKEGRLKGILGVVFVAEDSTTDTQDQPAVTLDQGRERGLLALINETLQELGIAQGLECCGARHLAKVA